jgi:hypothetical protein
MAGRVVLSNDRCAIIPSMPSMLQIPTQGNQRGFAQRPAKTTRESKTCLQQPPQTRHRCQTHLLSTVRLLLPRFRGKLLYVVEPYERTAISQKDLYRSMQNVLPRKKLKPKVINCEQTGVLLVAKLGDHGRPPNARPLQIRIAPAGRGACVCDSGHLALQLAASKENVPTDSPTLLGIDDLRKSWSFANRLWSLMVITSSSHRAPTPR